MNKIRLLHAQPFYSNYISKIYADHSELADKPYADQYRTIMSDHGGLSDSWKKNLEKTGLYEVMEVMSNVAPIQKRWADEHGIKYSEENWALDIIEAQIDQFKPEILFMRDFNSLRGGFAARIKQRFPFLKKIIVWDGIAKNDVNLFANCDIILTSLGSVAEFYKQHGFQAFYMQHGFEASVLEKVRTGKQNIDCSFIGSAGIAARKHLNRLDLLSYVSRQVPLELRAAQLPHPWDLIKRNIKKLVHFNASGLFGPKDYLDISRLNRVNKEEVFGLEMYQVLADSKITLNMHIETTGTKCGNMRMFEATGVGACLVTDWKDNLDYFFEDGVEVVSYRSKEECLEKIKFLLANPAKRAEIARKGQQRTLKDHTLERIVGNFGKELAKILK